MVNNNYDQQFYDAGKKWNVDPALIKTVFHLESGGNPNTKDSYQGAQGGMQFLPATAREMGIKDIHDMNQVIEGAAHYLSQGLDKTGTPEGALMYYHGGPDTRGWGPKTQAYALKGASFYPNMGVNASYQVAANTTPGVASDVNRDAVINAAVGRARGAPTSDVDSLINQITALAPTDAPAPTQVAQAKLPTPTIAQATGKAPRPMVPLAPAPVAAPEPAVDPHDPTALLNQVLKLAPAERVVAPPPTSATTTAPTVVPPSAAPSVAPTGPAPTVASPTVAPAVDPHDPDALIGSVVTKAAPPPPATPVAPPVPQNFWRPDVATRNKLQPDPNYDYMSVLPFAINKQNGGVSLAVPSSVRDLGKGLLDLTEGMYSGTITPEGTMALANIVGSNTVRARGPRSGNVPAIEKIAGPLDTPGYTTRNSIRVRREYDQELAERAERDAMLTPETRDVIRENLPPVRTMTPEQVATANDLQGRVYAATKAAGTAPEEAPLPGTGKMSTGSVMNDNDGNAVFTFPPTDPAEYAQIRRNRRAEEYLREEQKPGLTSKVLSAVSELAQSHAASALGAAAGAAFLPFGGTMGGVAGYVTSRYLQNIIKNSGPGVRDMISEAYHNALENATNVYKMRHPFNVKDAPAGVQGGIAAGNQLQGMYDNMHGGGAQPLGPPQLPPSNVVRPSLLPPTPGQDPQRPFVLPRGAI